MRRPRPDYCPDCLSEDEVCPACGAKPWAIGPEGVCRARFNGPAPRHPLEIILVHRDTGERI